MARKQQTGKPNFRLSQIDGEMRAERFIQGAADDTVALSWATGALLRPDGAIWGDPGLSDLPVGDYMLARIDGRVDEDLWVLRKHAPGDQAVVSWTSA